MTTTRQLARQIKKTAVPGETLFPGVIGDASGNARVDGAPNFLLVTLNNGQTVRAYNSFCPAAPGLKVLLRRDPYGVNRWRIEAARDVYAADLSYPLILEHGDTHTWPGGDTTPIHIRQFQYLQVSVNADNPLSINIYPGWYQRADGSFAYFAGQTGLSLATHRPSSGARYVLVELDDDGQVQITDGAAKPLQNLLETDIPSRNTDCRALAAARMICGQRRIRDSRYNTDLHDLRQAAGDGTGLPEAPSDGKPYGRKNAAWVDLNGLFSALAHTHTASQITDFADAVRAVALTGLSTATNAVITAADSVLSALGKLQKQISDNLTTLTNHTGNTSNPHSTTASQVGAPALVSPSVADNFVSFSNTAGAQKDSGKKASDFVGMTVLVDTKDPTGWLDPDNIVRSYDETTRKITLSHASGYLEYYWRGTKYSLASPWVSDAHTASSGRWYLSSSNGSTFTWSTTPWDFDVIMAAIANYQTGHKFGLSETHGLMPWQSHRSDHANIGTWRVSGFALTGGTYQVQPSSPANADNTPGFDAGYLRDEDLQTYLPAWAEGTYTRLYYTGTGTSVFETGGTSIGRIGATYPKYNPVSGGNFSEVEMATGNYANYYQVLIPVTSDAGSQAYRMALLQPQYVYTSLAAAQAESINSYNLGNISSQFDEYYIYARLTIRTNAAYSTTGKFRIEALAYLSGTKASQIAVSIPSPTAENVPTNTATLAGPLVSASSLNVQAALEEANANLPAAVRAVLLTGLSTATNAVITAADSVLSALGKLQKQISDNLTTLTNHTSNTSNPHSTTASQVGAPALVSPSVVDNFVAFSSVGGLQKDSGKKASDFANASHTHNAGDITSGTLGQARLPFIPHLAQGRLTFESGVASSTTDQSAKGTLYYTLFSGNLLRLWDGSTWTIYAFSELSLALSMTSGKIYDVWGYVNTGAAAIQLSAAWTNDTTRSEALAWNDGVLTKSGDKSKLYLGTLRATGTNQGSLTDAQMFLWNYYNRLPRRAQRSDTSGHSYTSTGFRAWNNDTSQIVEFLIGWQDTNVQMTLIGAGYVATAGTNFALIGGLDTFTASAINNASLINANTNQVAGSNSGKVNVSAGYHFFGCGESGNASGAGATFNRYVLQADILC